MLQTIRIYVSARLCIEASVSKIPEKNAQLFLFSIRYVDFRWKSVDSGRASGQCVGSSAASYKKHNNSRTL